jgi:aminoglycoside phosphotransferase family enzyme
MTKEQINKLLLEGNFAGNLQRAELIETHISWVFLLEHFVYKLKKPIKYSFLDFSTIEKRKYYCEREIDLNKRLTDDVYLDVQAVCELRGHYFIGDEKGEIIDYSVRMRKLDRNKQMDALLVNDQVTQSDIANLANKIASFHKNTHIIYQKDFLDVQEKFNDLGAEKSYLEKYLNANCNIIISNAIEISTRFIESNKNLLANRLKAGFFRDCHGDLHSRNIFLLPSPQPFDCIEFNDDYRQIDVLNEIAFLCMDLDVFGRQDLSDLFLKNYNKLFPCIRNEADRRLFIYYKSYRSNIRAKVHSLRARDATNDADRKVALDGADKYLHLMDCYIKMLDD